MAQATAGFNQVYQSLRTRFGAVLSVAIAVGGAILILAAGVVVAMAALALAGIALVAFGVAWLIGKVRGKSSAKRDGERGPTVLHARKGARGWSVDVAGDHRA